MNDLTTIARSWISAFNAHDLKKLLDLYHENAEHYSPKLRVRHPETEGLIRGKENLRKWFKESLERLPSLQYELILLTADQNQVFMEYIRKVEGEADLQVGEVLVIKENVIIASRVYHS